MSNSGKDRSARKARIEQFLRTPVLYFNDVPLVCFDLGGPPVAWMPFTEGRPAGKHSSLRTGAVYFARRAELVKIGFSDDPFHRISSLHTQSALLVAPVQPLHERALHEFFDSDRQSGEWFRGYRVERFIELASMRTPCTPRQWRGHPFYSGRFMKEEISAAGEHKWTANGARYEREEWLRSALIPPYGHYEIHTQSEAAE